VVDEGTAIPADSAGFVELYAATPAYKALLAARMLFADLGALGIPIKLSAPILYTQMHQW